MEINVNKVLVISISLLSPDFALNKFYPKYNYEDITKINSIKLDSTKEIQIKITRPSLYGERYKLFVIESNSFDKNYSLEDYGISLAEQEGKTIVDTLDWKGLAKKDGIETGDIITEFKIENLDRPNKAIIYPFALLFLFVFGYLNYKRKPSL